MCIHIYIYTWDKEWTQLFSVYLLLHINSDHYANGIFLCVFMHFKCIKLLHLVVHCFYFKSHQQLQNLGHASLFGIGDAKTPIKPPRQRGLFALSCRGDIYHREHSGKNADYFSLGQPKTCWNHCRKKIFSLKQNGAEDDSSYLLEIG